MHAILGSIVENLPTRLLRWEKNGGRIANHQRKCEMLECSKLESKTSSRLHLD